MIPSRNTRIQTCVIAVIMVFGGLHASTAVAKPLPYTGVNMAGGEFYEPEKVAALVYGTNVTYPSPEQFQYFKQRGMNIFRLCFRWETLQPKAKGPFRTVEMARLKAVVESATSRGLVVILDPHNYARYFGKLIGGPDVGDDVLADFWGRLSTEFKKNKRVWFGLMNEPHDMPTEQWLNAANAAIGAIRKAGANNTVLVPGNGWTGAHAWLADWYGGSNGEWMQKIKDPKNNYIFEAHQYLDSDSSGSTPNVVSATIGSERLRAFTQWCRQHKKQAFLGELAVPATPLGQTAIDDMLSVMERDRDVWVGFTWWAAGGWWGDYMFTLEPKDGQDRPQMEYLKPHLQPVRISR